MIWPTCKRVRYLSTTNEAWLKLWQELGISEQLASASSAPVTATQIKDITGREPRLMTKFDTRASRPQVLLRHGCTILPTSNGTYEVVSFDGYHEVQPASETRTHNPGALADLTTLPWRTNLSSESQVLDAAMISGVLRNFTNETELHSTIRGRLRSPDFDFFATTDRQVKLAISGVQVEVDLGLEGRRIYLLEAKIGERSDFIARQLYYPYRMWRSLVPSKEVVPLFVYYSNRTFCIREYRFAQEDVYGSLQLTSAVDYTLDQAAKPLVSIALGGTLPAQEPPGLPFPQADSLAKVLDTVDAVALGVSSRADLAAHFEFDERQSDYYGNAGAYLGFLEKRGGSFRLTGEGHTFVSADRGQRTRAVLRTLASRNVFRRELEDLISGCEHDPARVAERILRCRPEIASSDTATRRARTVLSWVRGWVSRNAELW